MREILFKGKRKDTLEWITGHLLWFKDGTAVIAPSNTRVNEIKNGDEILMQISVYEVIPETVRQYTTTLSY